MKQNIKKRSSEYDDDDSYQSSRYVKEEKRRPIRNYKRAWYEHEENFEDVDDFFTKQSVTAMQNLHTCYVPISLDFGSSRCYYMDSFNKVVKEKLHGYHNY